MTEYNTYAYIYPPRPEYKIRPQDLNTYDNGTYIAQPKYNGTCSVIFMNDEGFLKVMNRYNEPVTLVDKEAIDFFSAYRGIGFMVLCAEILNKNKKGENGKPFNQKAIIWDILAKDSIHLLGTTTAERRKLLEDLYGDCHTSAVCCDELESYKHLCITSGKGVYRAPFYDQDFTLLYDSLTETDLYEGLVLKRTNAVLSNGWQARNNNDWQIKCRKETKNYLF